MKEEKFSSRSVHWPPSVGAAVMLDGVSVVKAAECCLLYQQRQKQKQEEVGGAVKLTAVYRCKQV